MNQILGNRKLTSVSVPSHFYCSRFEDKESQISCSLGFHWRCVLWLNWECCFNCYSVLVTLKSFSLIFPLWTSWWIRWLLNPWTSEVEPSCDSKELTHWWRTVMAELMNLGYPFKVVSYPINPAQTLSCKQIIEIQGEQMFQSLGKLKYSTDRTTRRAEIQNFRHIYFLR